MLEILIPYIYLIGAFITFIASTIVIKYRLLDITIAEDSEDSFIRGVSILLYTVIWPTIAIILFFYIFILTLDKITK